MTFMINWTYRWCSISTWVISTYNISLNSWQVLKQQMICSDTCLTYS